MTARRSVATTAVAASAFLLPVLFSPSVDAPFWSPKAALLLIVGAVGLCVLPSLWRTELRRAAVAGAAFLGVAALSTALSSDPASSVVGLYNWGTGLVFLLACAGAWALGTTVPPAQRSYVAAALLAGIGLSMLVALAQALDLVPITTLEARGRVSGLAGNAVHLGSLAAAVVAVAAFRARDSLRWLALAAAGAFVIQLSGTRLALLVLLPITVAALRRCGIRTAAMLVLALVLGVAAGTAVGEVQDLQTASGRASADGGTGIASGGGARVRLEVWAYARHAVVEAPLLGSGPGRFRAATSADRSLKVAQVEGGDSIYTDAHNLVVEHVVTTGLLGLLALGAWLVQSFRIARGELAWAAAALLLMGLAQPMSVGTTPLMFLCLGIAGTTAANRVRRLPAVAAGVLGVALGIALLVGDGSLQQARLDFHLADARRARTLLRPWPEPAARLATIHAYNALTDPSELRLAVAWRRRAVAEDPTDPMLHVRLGDAYEAADQPTAARLAYLQALRHNPWSTSALARLARLADRAGDHVAARRYAQRALLVRPNRALERLVDAKRPGP